MIIINQIKNNWWTNTEISEAKRGKKAKNSKTFSDIKFLYQDQISDIILLERSSVETNFL